MHSARHSLTPAQPLTEAQPLSEAQKGLWFAQRLAPLDSAFNTAHVLWLSGELEVTAFTLAANQAVREAQSLRLRFANANANTNANAGPCQWLDDRATPLLELVDLRQHVNASALAEAQMQADYLTPLDPTRDRLAKQQLFILGQSEGGEPRFAWYLRVHHLVNDGYGMALLAERVHALYSNDLSQREFAPLWPVLAEDAEYQASARRIKDASYWHSALAELPPPASLSIHTNTPQADSAPLSCYRKMVALDGALMAELQAVASAQNVPWPDVLTALTAEYCRRFTLGSGSGSGESDGENEVVVGVPYMGRLGSKSARLPAMVMNVLPLALREPTPELNQELGDELKQESELDQELDQELSQQQSLAEFISHTARELTRGRRHGRYRGEQLRRDLGLIGGQRRLYGPLINVQPFYQPLAWPDLSSQLDILSTGPVDDITFGFRGDANARLDLEIEANPALYSQTEVDGHGARLPEFLRAAFAVYQANGQRQDIPLATPEEAERYLFEVNDTAHPVPNTTLVALYEAQMAATPHATALVFNEQTLSFAELESRTRALALQLIALGVGRDAIVAVALPRSLELVIALVAIQRAGGAYLPLDSAQPDERLMRILDSAQPVCLLTAEVTRFASWRDVPLTVLAPQDWQTSSDLSLTVEVQPGDAAYVIYTSGSTGEPKGVVVEHQAIVNRLLWMQDYFAIDANERILQKTPATFDVSVWEFFLSLISGAQLVIAPPDAHQDPRLIAELIRQHHITTLHFVPSMLAAFLASPNINSLKLRRVIVSGEALSASLRDRFHQLLDARLFNLYGPTEAAVDVSVWEASRDDTSTSVPIGVPVWNTQLYVLDKQLQPLPPGVAGDLYLGGVQLARGYLGQPELTAASFIEHTFTSGETADQRLYKSGDVARFRRDGAIEYLGRSDHQVKLRGLRIELGDISHALSTAPGVASAQVLLSEEGNEPRLIAYIKPALANAALNTNALDTDALRTHLAARLPSYMIPSAFVRVADWPLSANGKLDRKALPLPEMAESAGGELNSDTERTLARLFAAQLNLSQPIGAQDDFFALGGDSLSAVHLLLAIQARWHWDPGFGALFANPTVAALAALIDAPQDRADDGLGPYITLATGEADLAPVFTIHPAGGIAWNYRELAQALVPKRTVFGLQSPALQSNEPVESIDDLAARYVATLTELYPSGPVHLVGWSVGGIIAHAMAICLTEQGREVGRGAGREVGREIGIVALLDAYPAECWRAEPEPDAVAALRALLAIAGFDPELHLDLDSREKIVAFLRQGDSTLGNLPEAALDGVVRAVTSTNLLVRHHYHQHFKGQLLHLRAGRDHQHKPQLQSSLWAEHAGTLEAIELPYLHAEMTSRDASAQIAPLLSTRLAQYDRSLNAKPTDTKSISQEFPCN